MRSSSPLHRRHLPAKVRSFVDFLVDRFGTEAYWDQGIRPRGETM